MTWKPFCFTWPWWSGTKSDLVFVEGFNDLGTITGKVATEQEKEPYAELVIQAYRGDQAIENVRTDATGQIICRCHLGNTPGNPDAVRG
jgi:hypothetical protein